MESRAWTSHPLYDEPPAKSALLIVIILVTSVIIGWSFQSNTFAFISLVLLTLAMSRYFLATHYTIDDQGISISFIGHSRQIPWTQFNRVDQHPDGIFVSPFHTPHRLDTFRGQFLKTGPQTQEIFHVVQHHIKNRPI